MTHPAPRPVAVRWLDPDPAGTDVAGAVAVLEAARRIDDPGRPAQLTSAFVARLRHGWDGEPPRCAVAAGPGRPVTGVLLLSLPTWDNTHMALLHVVVDPAARRRGTGRALFAAGMAEIRAAGRTLVTCESLGGTPGDPFLRAMGLTRRSVAVVREQDLTRTDRCALATRFAGARQAASGYELLRSAMPTPAALLTDVARLTAAMNDAPLDALDYGDEVFSPERITAFETAQAGRDMRLYRLIARHRDSGAPAGQTVVGVEAEQPWFCWQYDTAVLREHRGHRLGLALKLAMLDWLAEAEPQVRVLRTDNAASNSYMVRINEALGYRITGELSSWQRHV